MRSQPNGRFCICEIAAGERLCCFSSFFFFFLSFFLHPPCPPPLIFFFFFPVNWKDSQAVPGKLASLWITGYFPSTVLPDNVCLSLSPSLYCFALFPHPSSSLPPRSWGAAAFEGQGSLRGSSCHCPQGERTFLSEGSSPNGVDLSWRESDLWRSTLFILAVCLCYDMSYKESRTQDCIL